VNDVTELRGGRGIFRGSLLVRRVLCWTGVSLFLVFAVSTWVKFRQPADARAGETAFVVAPETSFRKVAHDLQDLGLVRSDVPLSLAARILGVDRRVRYGTYMLSPAMTPWEILRHFAEGRIREVQVTIPEGADIFEIADLLESAGVLAGPAFLDAVRNPAYLEPLGIPGTSAEGYCYPDTYRFPEGTPPEFVLRKLVDRFRERLGRMFSDGGYPRGLRSATDVLVLASIVEREARVPEERGIIAGVYLNRLRRGMRLEADPTAAYGTRRRGERITKEDIRRKSPYNTYHVQGLPPGPIANPGEEAILAVLNPRETDSLYFVARGDGTHVFSRTFRAHRRAVRSLRHRGDGG